MKIKLTILISLTLMFNLFSKNHTIINVSFIDSESKEVIAQSKMPIEQLPDTFELNTELNIGGKKYSVTNAEPLLKSEFEKSGKLKITLTPIKYIDPKKILFTLPTICDGLPTYVKANQPLEKYYVTHEDNWRQFEYIHKQFEKEVNQEISSIESIIKNNKVGIGYNQIHVRKKITDPKVKLSLRKFIEYFPEKIKIQKLAINNQKVENSFSIEYDGVNYFGKTDSKNVIQYLCMNIIADKYKLAIAQKIGKDNKLLLVHWPSANKIN